MTAGRCILDTCRRHPVRAVLFGASALVWVWGSVRVGLPAGVAVVLPVLVGCVAAALHRWTARRPPVTPGRKVLRAAAQVTGSTVVVFAAIQAVPYGREHTNPPVTGEPAWADAETRELMVRSCYACHSNQVTYPSAAHVAPISWIVQRQVDEGRRAVNYSEFASDPGAAGETIRVILDGSMPPASFTSFGRNRDAVLSVDELAVLVAGLEATPGMRPPEDR